MHRGEIWWASLEAPKGSAPGFRRPVVVVQSNEFNASRIQTVIAVPLSSNTALAPAPGNVLIKKKDGGLSKDSVANVSQIVTLDKTVLTGCVGSLPPRMMKRIEDGLRLILAL